MADHGKAKRHPAGPKRSSDAEGSIGNVSTVSSVVREQYCMCAPRTRLERRLIIAVLVLVFVVACLLAALIAVAVNRKVVQQVLEGLVGVPPKHF